MSNQSTTSDIALSLKTQVQNTESDGTVSTVNSNPVIVQDTLVNGVAVDQASRAWERKNWSLASGQSEVVDIFDFDNLDIGAGEGKDGLGQLLLCSNLAAIVIKVESGTGSLEVEPDETYGFDPIGIHTVVNDGAIKAGGVIFKYAPDAVGFVITHRSSQRIKFTAAGGAVVYSVRLILRDADNLPTTLAGLDLWMRADLDVSTGGSRQFTAANLEYFSIADNAALSTGDIDFSLFGWIYLDTKASNKALISKYETTGNQREYSVRYDQPLDRFVVQVSNDGIATVTKADNNLGSPAVGNWYFVVVEHDSVANTLSIQANNGTIDSVAHTTGVFDGTAPVHIGASDISAAPYYMDGRIARVGFRKATLSTAERSQLYNSGGGMFYNDLPSGLLTSLISYWNLNEVSGNAIDNHSTNDLADQATVTSADGITPRVRQFTLATTEYLDLADNADLSVQDIDFAFAGWVRLDTKATDQVCVAKNSTTGNQRAYLIAYDTSSDRFKFHVSDDGALDATAVVESDVLGATSTGVWYFIVAEHDASANTISIEVNDGGIDQVAWSAGVFDNTAAFSIGRDDNGSYMDGNLSRWGFWKRTLTALERTSLYNSGQGLGHAQLSTSQKVSLISFWDLNEVAGDALDSESTNDLTDNATVTSELGPFEAVGPVIDGDPVAQWIDRSGNNKAFSQGTLAKRPTYRATGINSLPSIEFDGIDDLLVLAEDYLSGAEGTAIAVVELSASPSDTQVVLGTSDDAVGNDAIEFRAYHSAALPNLSARVDDNTSDNIPRGSTTVAVSTIYIQVWLSDGTAYSLRVNGAAETVALVTGLDNGNWFSDVANKDSVSIGAAKRASEVNFLKGDLAELIVYDHDLTTSELLTIETYLATRYGITLAS